ncbi:MAG TPA: hypothetical protein VFL57_20440, partial [Bryobacteraceae bacterium]|nr:hypothetical protein [Bryobacteraceae bacterium]
MFFIATEVRDQPGSRGFPVAFQSDHHAEWFCHLMFLQTSEETHLYNPSGPCIYRSKFRSQSVPAITTFLRQHLKGKSCVELAAGTSPSAASDVNFRGAIQPQESRAWPLSHFSPRHESPETKEVDSDTQTFQSACQSPEFSKSSGINWPGGRDSNPDTQIQSLSRKKTNRINNLDRQDAEKVGNTRNAGAR